MRKSYNRRNWYRKTQISMISDVTFNRRESFYKKINWLEYFNFLTATGMEAYVEKMWCRTYDEK